MLPAHTYIIVPAYKEAEVIRQTLLSLLPLGAQIILVDDASPDATRQAVAKLPIHYLRHPVNLGQGAALMTGMAYARRLDAAYVVHFDADGQHQPQDVEALLAPLVADESDVVLGSRFLSPQSRAAIPTLRRYLLRLAVLFHGLFTRIWLSDAHNGLRALNARALTCIELRENGMAHATEILLELRRHHLRIREVPVEIRYTDYSRSKGQSAWNAFPILSDMLFRKLLP